MTIGSEMSGGIHDIEFHNNVIHQCRQGIHVKTAEGRGGFVKRVSIFNCEMLETHTVLRLNAYYRGDMLNTQYNKVQIGGRSP